MNQLNKTSCNVINKHSFNKVQKMFLHKSVRPTLYNLRQYYSNMKRYEFGYSRWDQAWAPDGYDKAFTERNPTAFKYKTNLFSHSYNEIIHIYGDAIYNMVQRRHRYADPFFKYFYPFLLSGLYILSGQHIAFMNAFLFAGFSGIARLLSKTEEPRLDEVWLFDFLLKNEKTKDHLKWGSFHVIDFNMEFDKGLDNPLFPDCKLPVARFFNTDTGCCTGNMKLGDLETGSLVTVHFKTMPYSANQFFYADPFLVYDMKVETNRKGYIETHQLIEPKEVLEAKKIFIPLF